VKNIVDKLPQVLAAVNKNQPATPHAMVLLPVANIFAAISIRQYAPAVHFPRLKIALIAGPVRKLSQPVAILAVAPNAAKLGRQAGRIEKNGR